MMLEGGGTTVVANEAHWRGPGHNAVLQDDGRTWLVYHALDPAGKPSLTLRIDTVRWTADGWPEVDKPAPPVTGWWEHSVAGKAASTIHLLPDGRIDGPGGSATWTLSGNTLEMRWPDPRARRCVCRSLQRCRQWPKLCGPQPVGCADRRPAERHRLVGTPGRGGRRDHGPVAARRPNQQYLTTRQPGHRPATHWSCAGRAPLHPAAAWIDTLRLSADRGVYDGHNQNGIRISGWQVASE